MEVRLFSFEAVVLSSEETGLSPSLARLRYLFLPSLALFSPNHILSLCVNVKVAYNHSQYLISQRQDVSNVLNTKA